MLIVPFKRLLVKGNKILTVLLSCQFSPPGGVRISIQRSQAALGTAHGSSAEGGTLYRWAV